MSNQHIQDLKGIIRGLYVIKQNANLLQRQRPIQNIRVLTQNQRDKFVKEKELYEFQKEIELQDQIHERELAELEKRERERMNADERQRASEILKMQKQKQEEKSAEEKVNEKENLIKSADTAKITEEERIEKFAVKPGEYVVDKNKGNKLYVEQKKAKDRTEAKQEETVDHNRDTPFFMRQDRPKFSAQERYVPSNAASRAAHFGMLGAQLVGGTVAEAIRQKVGISKADGGNSGLAGYALNQKNADRLANNFKKMRGGALKIGQLLSTSEESILPPIIREAMEKARSEANIMPLKQVKKNLIREYGTAWENHFNEINLYPFAAASIGQVHEAVLTDGMKVAIKMQYSGIANSIDSDLNNFKRIIDMLGIIPRGLYLNEVLDVARAEMHWECDYEREAAYQRAYREHTLNYPKDFYTPKVVDDLSSKSILCSEFVEGIEIDTFMDAPQELRNRIGSLLISLCFKELFEFKLMQTDPNPANYLFDESKDILNLIDFGAGRDFDQNFLDSYMQVIWGAFKDDKQAILQNSFNIGFLTGEENKDMFNAQYKGTMIVGEPFRTEPGELYDFGTGGITKKVHTILPTLSKHRLTPPPQEVYSLHKKIIGSYLMCIKLRSQVPARQILEETYANWRELHGDQYYQRMKDQKIGNRNFL